MKDGGQTRVGSRWVIIEKEQHDGQKTKVKAILVTQGFQETLKPQSDSPRALKESFKLLMALAANFHFKLASIDIRAAFLQSKVLDREVYVEPPADIKKNGIVWKLNKPLYGLDDVRIKFWLRVRDVFLNKLQLKTVEGDEVFYYRNLDGDFQGAVLTHVDDFEVTGTTDFVDEIIAVVEKELTISKVEEDKVRYTGLDVKIIEDGIEIRKTEYRNDPKK